MYSGNADFIKIDSTDMGPYFKTYDFEIASEDVDVTAGANTEWRETNAGLLSGKLTLTFSYDESVASLYIQKLRPGTKPQIEIGPQGAVSGKERHVQTFHINSVKPSGQTVEKNERTFVVACTSDGAPSVDMFNGGTYS